MPYDDQHFKKLSQRDEKAAKRLVPCMNDTKWRELFLCAAKHSLLFQFAWVRETDDKRESSYDSVRESCIDVHGLRDPGLGGPCLYREILWIRFPFAIHNSYWGQVPKSQPLEQFLQDLKSIGLLPIKQTAEYVEVWGYQV